MLPDYLETADPGNCTGWAEFWRGQLKACAVWDLDAQQFPFLIVPEAHWVIEEQQIHKDTPNPQSIIKLAHTAGRIADRVGWKTVEWVYPTTWKRNADPDLMCEWIIKALSPVERLVYFAAADRVAEGVRHNIIDAIGIGLWKLRRLPR